MLATHYLAPAIAGGMTILAAIPSVAFPPQPGSYWGGGSRYITIMRRQDNNRLCYQGASPRGTVIASLAPIRQNPRLYSIHGFNAIALTQEDAKTLMIGQLTTHKTTLLQPTQYRLEGFATLTKELKQCLNSSTPFHRAISSD